MDSKKVCVGCERELATDAFVVRATGRRDARCKQCRSAYQHAHYLRNRARYVSRAAKNRRQCRDERALQIFDYLRIHPCEDCGESDPLVLEFDHLGDKGFTIGAKFYQRSSKALWEEIAKCEVVCANCHARRTARRRNTLRFQLLSRAYQRKLFWSG